MTCAICGAEEARFTDPTTDKQLCRTDRQLILSGVDLAKAEALVAYLTPATPAPAE